MILKPGMCIKGKSLSELTKEELRERLQAKGNLRAKSSQFLGRLDAQREKNIKELYHNTSTLIPYKTAS